MITVGASRVASGLLCLHAIAITPAGPMEFVRSSLFIVCGLPCVTVRSAPAIVFSGPAQRSLMLWPARSPSRQATLYIESSDSFVASAAASIATGWSEPVPGRELHPLKSSAFSRRTVTPTDPVRMKISDGSECFHVHTSSRSALTGLCCYGQPVCFLFPLRSVQAHHEEPQEHRSFHEEGGGHSVGGQIVCEHRG